MSRIFSFILVFTLLFSITAQAGYHSDVSKVTKKGSLYNTTQWDAKLLWSATLFTDEFRKSFAEEHIKVEHLEATEAARYFADQMKKQENSTEFMVFLYTKKDYKKFSSSEDAFWKVFLELPSGEKVKPSTVESLPQSPYIQVMFPHVNRWSKVYRVTFPKQDLHGNMKLHLQSVVGESVLKWKLR